LSFSNGGSNITYYHSKAGPLNEVVGTYELTTYKKKDPAGNHFEALTPMQMKAYLVIGSDGYGYYVYKDKNTELHSEQTKIKFTYETDDNGQEDTTLIKAVSYVTGNEVKLQNQKPGAGKEPTMGFNVKKHTLSYTINETHYKIGNQETDLEYAYTEYTRISDKTDLSVVEEKLKTTISMPRYELKNINKPLYLYCNENSEHDGLYDYFVIDIDNISLKATVYYREKDGSEDVVLNGLTVEAEFMSSDASYYTAAALTIPVLDRQFFITVDSYGKPASSLSAYTDDDPTGFAEETLYPIFTSLEEYISSLSSDTEE